MMLPIWPPDRKILYGAISTAIAWVILSLLAKIGVDPQPIFDSIWSIIGPPEQVAPNAQGILAAIIGYAIAYLVPPAWRDILKRVNDEVIAVARVSPDSPASSTPQPVTPEIAKTVEEVTGKEPPKVA